MLNGSKNNKRHRDVSRKTKNKKKRYLCIFIHIKKPFFPEKLDINFYKIGI